jgi:steroid 5-alpha reductase family enzyme
VWAEFLCLWLAAWLFGLVLMALTWRLAIRIGNAGIVDIAWAAGFAPLVIFYAAAGGGAPARRGLIAVMVSLWSLRLGTYLYVRVSAHHPLEDQRYARLRRQWGAQVNRKMFGFFQLQAALLALLSVPWLLVCLNRHPRLQPLEGAGCLLWLIAISGEALADRQLQHFKAEPANRRAVCQTGLWRYSRHPNYFFEWLVWLAYFVVALGSPWGWLTLYCPALMLYFLLRVTGIPLTEQLSLQSKGSAFADYQRRTSAFVPWFPKRD